MEFPIELENIQILYIEDHPMNIVLIEDIFSDYDQLTLTVETSGKRGIKKAMEMLPDLILLDMRLPDLDGKEVIQQLISCPGTKDIPIIGLSANALEEDMKAAKNLGCFDYITKPFELDSFFQVIKKAIECSKS